MKVLKFITCITTPLLVYSCCWNGVCDDDDNVEPINSKYEPITLNRKEFEESIILSSPRKIQKSGKIYVIKKFLYINDVNKGFHIYDNSDPVNPILLHFLSVPGATDLAIRNDTFYINQATDLIAISTNINENSIKITKRIPNTFPKITPPDGFFSDPIPEDHVIIDWKKKENTNPPQN